MFENTDPSDVVVLYHDPCYDGFTAAWAVWEYFGDGAEYVGMQYGTDPAVVPDVTGRKVVMVDYSLDREVMVELHEASDGMVVLDHHASAEREMKGLDFCLFESDKSGARMAWEYFHPDQSVPWIVAYVEDRDLWKWELPSSKQINAALRTYDFSFDRWHQLAGDSEGHLQLIPEGRAVLRHVDRCAREMVECAHTVTIGGWEVLATNAPILQSEVAGMLAEDTPFGVAWSRDEEGRYRFSLRATQGTDHPDLSEIAEFYGGGGHAAAAGFRVDAEGFDWIVENRG